MFQRQQNTRSPKGVDFVKTISAEKVKCTNLLSGLVQSSLQAHRESYSGSYDVGD